MLNPLHEWDRAVGNSLVEQAGWRCHVLIRGGKVSRAPLASGDEVNGVFPFMPLVLQVLD